MYSGVVSLLDHRSTDWYVFIKATLTQQDAALIETLMEVGEQSQYSVNELNMHPNKAFGSSGSLEQILNSLDAFGETQSEAREKAPSSTSIKGFG